MRALPAAALVLIVALGCSGGPGGASPTASSAATASPTATASPAAPSSLTQATAAPASPTADDEQLATLIRSAAAEAIPQLRVLNRSDPSQLEDLFLPLGEWIAAQRTAVAALTPSGCTEAAVELFHDGLDQYDDIREKFLAWRDWGANGHAFPPGAPNLAIAAFEEAQVELDAHCPAA